MLKSKVLIGAMAFWGVCCVVVVSKWMVAAGECECESEMPDWDISSR